MRRRWGFGTAFAVVALILWTAVAPAGFAGTGGAAVPATLSGAFREVHDPTMVREGDHWYVLSTNDGIAIRRSTDLQHWERAGSVFPDAVPAWVYAEIPRLNPAERLAWAPDLSYVDGRWHLYWSVAVFGTRDAIIGLATNATLDPGDPDYEWVDEGLVLSSDDTAATAAIDPNAVTDETGNRWLVWGSFWGGIYVRQVDPVTGKFLAGAPEHNIGRRKEWWHGIEGANVVRHDGWWWLVASYGFCCKGVDSTYSTHIGRSRSLTGPYVDAAGNSMLEGGGTTLVGSYDNVIGPGHGDVVAVGEGLVYAHHYYDALANGTPSLSIRELLWGPDGWPVAVDPGFVRGRPAAAVVAGQWRLRGYPQECVSRSPDDVTLTLRADGTASPSGHWEIDGDLLRIRDVDVGGQLRDWWLMVGQDNSTGFGRDDRTAAARAARTSGRTDGATTLPCGPVVPSADREPPPATAVPAAPTFTG